MPVYEIYSRRKRRAENSEPDVYQYDQISESLRVQVRRIMEDAIGPYCSSSGFYTTRGHDSNDVWRKIRDAVCREKGKLTLSDEQNPETDCLTYIHYEKDVDEWLDLVEFAFVVIERYLPKFDSYVREEMGIRLTAKKAINELNRRFRDAAFGYQYENSQVVRVDSELVHAEVVRPALRLLSDRRFAGAEEEFLAAHVHYRNGEHRDAIVDALSSFESTMKTICDQMGWEHKKGARASDLIKVIRANGLLPAYLDNSFDQLAATLQSGLPKVRNEEGSHGQGAQPTETPSYIAAYALHLAAANIVFLVEAFNDATGQTK